MTTLCLIDLVPASQLGIGAEVCDYLGLDGHGFRPLHSLCISCFVLRDCVLHIA